MAAARISFILIAFLLSLPATTLQRLSLDDMTAKSTAIVRGRVTSSYAAQSGALIFTHFKVQVLERWKGPASAEVDVAVPGGTLGAKKQSVAGAPVLETGSEYMFFLWTGQSGVTQIIGLSQGVMDLKVDASGAQYVVRSPGSDPMVDLSGQAVKDAGIQMALGDLSSRISKTLAARSPR